ncbi:MAG: filamentous hemagglutinin N-terminal domain-containing protein, partial [Janthinobacterium lividum]
PHDFTRIGMPALRQPLIVLCRAGLARVSCLLTLATACALAAVPATWAQIVSDVHAPGNQRATILAAPNNVPLVNIQTPSNAGVSRNAYSQFDVQQAGAILNNSRSNASSQLGGYVQGNPWLANGSARVILNEVNSANPSQLRGHVEVAGQRAQVVVANPAGVKCDGCGFINASRATLTTGTPVVNGGSLEGYRVHGGTVRVEGAGMDASSTDYTEVITRAVELNAGLWAKELKIATGPTAFTIDGSNGELILNGPLPAAGPAPAFAIDTALLGGMYAGKIKLIATEQGVGVSHAGKMYADIGEVVITADGKLVNAGQINSKGNLTVATSGDIDNRGSMHAQGSADLSSHGIIDNTGTVAARQDVTLAAVGSNSSVRSGAASVLAAGVLPDGSLGGTGHLSVTAMEGISATGKNLSSGNQAYQAPTINLSGSQTSASKLTLNASAGEINLAGADISILQGLTANAGTMLVADAANINAGEMNLAAQTVLNRRGWLASTGSLRSSSQAFNNTEGWISANTDLELASETVDNSRGKISARATASLRRESLRRESSNDESSNGKSLRSQSFINNAGQVTAGQGLSIDTPAVLDNRGGLLAASGRVDLHAQELDNRAGSIASVSGSARVVSNSLIDNSGGSIQADTALDLEARGIYNNAGGAVISTGPATISTVLLDNLGGQIQSLGNLGIEAASLVHNTAGLIRSSRDLTIIAVNVINSATHAAAGTKEGDENGNANTAPVAALPGKGMEGQNVSIRTANLGNHSGVIRSNTETVLTVDGGLDNRFGLISGGQSLTLQDNTPTRTLAIDNQDGTLIAGEQLRINGDSLSGNGKILTLGHSNIGLAVDFTNQGQVIANGTLSLSTPGKLINDGTLAAGEMLAIDAGTIDNRADGSIKAGNVELHASDSHTLTNRGLIDGIHTTLGAITLDNLGSGRIYGDRLAITATTLNNLAEHGAAPVIAARERLDMGVDTFNNSDHASVFSAGDLAIGAGLDDQGHAIGQAATINNHGATIEALGNADLSAGTINNINPHIAVARVE